MIGKFILKRNCYKGKVFLLQILKNGELIVSYITEAILPDEIQSYITSNHSQSRMKLGLCSTEHHLKVCAYIP